MFLKLRKKYPKFIYKKYFWNIDKNDLKISFDFRIEPDIIFNPKIRINLNNQEINQKILDNLVFNLGLIEMISYWKSTCSPIIEIEAGNLNKEQIDWWQELIIDGMGQFFYENKIDWRIDNFLNIKVNPKKELFNAFSLETKEGILLPIGGGKDSIVSLELLKNEKDVSCFALNPNQTIKKIFEIGECKNTITADREIDSKLLELNRKGFLNGHTPFSAYLAFLTILISGILKKKYIALSNERSSNEGNLVYLGKEINHQYSKSFHFEEKFREYSKKYLIKEVEYFSFLRPLYEIQIAKLFSKNKKYFKGFLSCNEAYKTKSCTVEETGKWCGQCSKCLFVFICLQPFLEKEELIDIFGKNLLEEKTSLPIIKELLGVDSYFKPFECVGTKEESLVALYLSWKKEKNTLITKYFEKDILPQYKNIEEITARVLNSWNDQNNLTNTFIRILKNEN